MNRQLDPYRQWLKIPVERRPPSYYDLVGVPDDETDRARIDDAAMDRIEQVRTRALGQYAAEVTQLLNELSQALDCLVDPDQREAYDRLRLRRVVDRWLESGRKPADFYELVDAHRFAPGRGHLVDTVRAAKEHLATCAPDDGTAAPAERLIAELDEAETALSGPSAFQQYHRPILAQLHNDYVRDHGNDSTLWDLGRLRAWLETERRVHPDRAEAIAFGLCEPQIEARDQLLVELFPVSGRADVLGRTLRARGDEEKAGKRGRSGASAAGRRKPPRLPRVYAEHEVADQREAGEPKSGRVGGAVRRIVRGFGRSRRARLAMAGAVLVGLTLLAVHWLNREPSPPVPPAPLSMESRERIRRARFEETIRWLGEEPPDYETTIDGLEAICSEFPGLAGLEREYALRAWCHTRLEQWPEAGEAYCEARTRLGPAREGGVAAPDEVKAWLDDVRHMVFFSMASESKAVWRDMRRLEQSLGGSLRAPKELASLVGLPDRPRGAHRRPERRPNPSEAAVTEPPAPKPPGEGPGDDADAGQPEDDASAAERTPEAKPATKPEPESAPEREPVVEPKPQPEDEPAMAEASGAVASEVVSAGLGGVLPTPGAAQPPPDHLLQIPAHQGPVCWVGWSPAGDRVATAGDTTTKLWDPWSGEMVRSLTEHTMVTDAAWCPESAQPRRSLIAVAGSDQKLRLFNAAASSGLPQELEAGSPVRCIDWSPNGTNLAAGLASGELCVFGPSKEGPGVRRATSSFQGICGVAWHPENRRQVALADEEGLVWIWETGRFLPVFGRIDVRLDSFRGMITGNPELREMLSNGELRVVNRPAGPCRGLAWAGDGDRLAVMENGIEIWEYHHLRGLRWSLALPAAGSALTGGPVSEFTALAWHPGDRSLAAGTDDGRVIVFDVLTGQPIREFRAPSAVTSVGWSRRGRHLTAGSRDGSLTVWGFER